MNLLVQNTHKQECDNEFTRTEHTKAGMTHSSRLTPLIKRHSGAKASVSGH